MDNSGEGVDVYALLWGARAEVAALRPVADAARAVNEAGLRWEGARIASTIPFELWGALDVALGALDCASEELSSVDGEEGC